MEAVQKLPRITYEEVRSLLHKAHLHIVKDRHFGDAEYYWIDLDDANHNIAEGYFGAGDGTITINGYSNRYSGDLAYDLRGLSHSTSVSYNDTKGE